MSKREQASPEASVLQLMNTYDFDLGALKASLTEKGLNVSFSNVTFAEIAPFVGLDPIGDLGDASSFDLCRSRIPTSLFQAIVEDMDILLIRYGNLQNQVTEEARSRFLAPIFNHIVAQFGGSIRNTPEPLLQDCITRGRMVQYFKAFDIMAVVFVEANLTIGTTSEHMDAIAQVIAECNACDFNNRQRDINMPIYGILCDRNSFLFFSFDGSTKPYKFSIGLVPGTHFRVGEGQHFDDFSFKPTAHSFIRTLRPICEIVFNLFLLTYIASLKAQISRDRSTSRPGQWKDLDGWEKALKFAEEVLEMSLEAEALRQKKSIIDADATVEAAFQALKLSTDAVPIVFGYVDPPLMDGWDDNEVSKV